MSILRILLANEPLREVFPKFEDDRVLKTAVYLPGQDLAIVLAAFRPPS